MTGEDGLIPVSKVMQINKVVHPRLNTEYLQKRRQLYQAKDWASYEKCVHDSFLKNIQVSQSGYKALKEVLGLD